MSTLYSSDRRFFTRKERFIQGSIVFHPKGVSFTRVEGRIEDPTPLSPGLPCHFGGKRGFDCLGGETGVRGSSTVVTSWP